MIKLISKFHFLSIIFIGLFLAVVAGCGGGGGSDPSAAANSGTGSVALLFTDAPSPVFKEINITVVKAELLSDDGSVTLFDGESTFNLLDLIDVRIFSIREGIKAGSYEKIRLTLTDIELVDYDDKTFHPKLPGNGKLDLKSSDEFDVVAGGTLAIQIDMDANKSIHIVKKGNKDEYQFRPVVFIDIVTDTFKERFIKLHGDIDSIDVAEQRFKLCNTDIPVQISDDEKSTDSRGCVTVQTDDSISIFDTNGLPTTFASLVEGEPATVFGRLQRESGSDDEGKDSDQDDDGNDNDKDGDENKNDDEDDERELDDLVLNAALIELGVESSFQKINGETTTVVGENNQFKMEVDPGQGLATPLNLNVQIQQGTQLINRKGSVIESVDINIGNLLNVRGVLDVDNKKLLATIITVDTDESTQLSGLVGDNPDNSCGFTVLTDEGDRSVKTDSNTKVFLVTSTSEDGSSRPIKVSDLSADQEVDVFGKDNNSTGCFEAHTIIAY